MYASKEQAANARANLVRVSDAMPPALRKQMSGPLIAIEEFLEAAAKKLPKESSFHKENIRSK